MPSISVKANKRYIDAVGVVAKRHNTTTAALVRSLLDKAHGEEIRNAESFLSSDHAQMDENNQKGMKGKAS